MINYQAEAIKHIQEAYRLRTQTGYIMMWTTLFYCIVILIGVVYYFNMDRKLKKMSRLHTK